MTSRPLPLVLLMESDVEERHRLQESLRTRFAVRAAESLRQASEALLTLHPTILLIDLDGLDSDGIGFITQAHADERLRAVSICCLSRRNGFQDKVRAFQSGADDYLVKPINVDSLPYRLALLTQSRQMQSFGGNWRGN